MGDVVEHLIGRSKLRYEGLERTEIRSQVALPAVAISITTTRTLSGCLETCFGVVT
jgi:hypothetical protein